MSSREFTLEFDDIPFGSEVEAKAWAAKPLDAKMSELLGADALTLAGDVLDNTGSSSPVKPTPLHTHPDIDVFLAKTSELV